MKQGIFVAYGIRKATEEVVDAPEEEVSIPVRDKEERSS
jgi:hypothetical protein